MIFQKRQISHKQHQRRRLKTETFRAKKIYCFCFIMCLFAGFS